MPKPKRKWDLISDDQRRTCIDKVIRFYEETKDEKIGMIAAEEILDLVLELTAEEIYSKGINDAQKLLQERFEGFQIDLDMLINK